MEHQADPHASSHDMLCIQLLGGFHISSRQAVVTEHDFRLRNAARLVKLLALAPDHVLHRESVMDWLWPDLPPDAAANNLRYTLHVARRVLRPLLTQPDEILRLTGQQIQLASPCWIQTDVTQFEQAVSLARRIADVDVWRAAVEHYTGELLPGDRYEDWTVLHRESLRETFLQTLTSFAGASEQSGDTGSAIDALEQAVALDPAREEAHVGLMRLYALRGQRQFALRQYGRLRAALISDLDVEPEKVSQQLYQAILLGRFPPGGGSIQAAIAEQEAPLSGRHNLPEPQNRFVGRSREIPEISALLNATRFLTLTGSGGVGKTRLALETARHRALQSSEDIWFVDLVALTDTVNVPVAVTKVLNIQETPGHAPVDQIIDALRESSTLLILDNCEHLVHPVASLIGTLLRECPGIRVLTTSREPLRVSGEVTYRVPSLPLPGDSIVHTGDLSCQAESVQLFVNRATQWQREFRLTNVNASLVADICRKLDGIPLAIELAAARVSTVSIEQIAARLSDALHLLTDGSLLAPARHQTLRSALAWSHELLSDAEQRLFRRLAVFAGGWTLEAAEAISSENDTESSDAIELLASLVDRSLVILDVDRPDLRYRMLEPVRQYAMERLRDADEISPVRNRHALFVLDFVTSGEPGLRGSSQGEWINRFEAEHDNLRAALHWSIETNPDIALRIAASTGRFWYIRSYGVEGRSMLEATLNAAPHAEPLIRARVLSHAGILADEAGDHALAAQHLEAALAIFRDSGDERGMATALNSLGAVARSSGEHERARQLFEESLALRQKLGDEHAINLVKSNLAAVALSMGNLDQAEVLLEETIPYERATGDEWSLAISLAHLGRIALARGEYLRAASTYIESSVLAMRTGDQGAAGEAVAGVASAAGAVGRPDLAAPLWGATEALRERISLPIPEPDLPFHLKMIAIARASANDSAFDEAWSRGRNISLEDALVLAQEAAEQIRHSKEIPMASLTSREKDIAALIAQGQTNGQIAATLGIAARTVDTHVSRILRKLGVSSRTEITAQFPGNPER
jgi:predicted ATPase/DNA-binding SARP family transcriptional activator/DNA-binding CsgD family transcriptional regulator